MRNIEGELRRIPGVWLAIGALIALVVVLVLLSGLRVAQEYQRGVVFRLGRLKGQKGPGLYWIIPLIDRQRVVDSRTVELGAITDDTLLPISVKPEEICIMVAGGPGTHSVYVPCFGNSFAATQEIRN